MLQNLYELFTPVQLATLSLLLFLFVAELIYLLFFYNRVSLFAGRAAAGKVEYAQQLPSVSVVVYAHAEEAASVVDLLPLLMSQNYPHYEVIVVNDGAAFEVQNAISVYECEYDNLYQTFIPERVYNVSRKKLGITIGIKAAKNDVIVVTEAHCKPMGKEWLQSIARNFTPGVDVVLGYTRMSQQGAKRGVGFTVYDRVVFALRYLACAVMRRPFMGMSGNIAYRREAFFANKGFSSTLNLHHGDDDLLINDIANRKNTRIELSPESVVESIYDNNKQAWEEMRMRYGFTSKYMHHSPRAWFALENVLHYLFWAMVALVVILSPANLISLIAAAVMAVSYWVLAVVVYHRACRTLGERFMLLLVPLFQLVRPFYTLCIGLQSRIYNRSNFTWQYLR